jgi:hypothetical protein
LQYFQTIPDQRKKILDIMDEMIVLDYNTVTNLLKPTSKSVFATEEELHPWRASCSRQVADPILRIWDHCSGSQPDAKKRMTSREPRKRLDTSESRKASLSTHLDHKDWTPTPFISFTTSATALQELANLRATRPHRAAQTLTVVDPNVRLAAGFPVLDVAAEMDHYDISDPYGRSNQYYKDHYVCLWQVSEREVVGQWSWSELITHGNWYGINDPDHWSPDVVDFLSATTSASSANELLQVRSESPSSMEQILTRNSIHSYVPSAGKD